MNTIIQFLFTLFGLGVLVALPFICARLATHHKQLGGWDIRVEFARLPAGIPGDTGRAWEDIG